MKKNPFPQMHVAVSIAALGLGSLLPGVAQTPVAQADSSQNCSRAQEEANKNLVISVKPGGLEKIMDPGYIQHNPDGVRFAAINGLTDQKATILMGTSGLVKGNRRPMLMPAPGKPADNLAYKVIAECDTVVVVGQHWHPYPDNPSQYYATYFFNMWRVKDGKLVEHWDPDDLTTPLPEFLKVPVKDLKPQGPPPAPVPPGK